VLIESGVIALHDLVLSLVPIIPNISMLIDPITSATSQTSTWIATLFLFITRGIRSYLIESWLPVTTFIASFKHFITTYTLFLNEIRKITGVRLIAKVTFSVENGNLSYRTLGDLINFDVSDAGFKALENILTSYLNEKYGEDNYTSITPVSIVFCYHLEHDPNIVINKTKTIIKSSINDKADKVVISGRNVPISKNIKDFGTLIKTSGNLFTISKPKTRNELYQITIHPDHNHVVFLNKGNIIFEFKDYFIKNANDFTFTRIYKNKEIQYENGKVLLATHIRPTRSFIPKQTAQKLALKKFFTLDIETLKVNSILMPICIALASKSKTWSYFINDHKSQDEMFLYAINSLIKSSNNGAIVYVHNLARFDGVYLLKWLSKLTDFIINPIMKDGLLIEIELIWISPSGKRIKLYFRDSYLLLPRSLRDLAIAFGVSLKGWFPFKFLNDLGSEALLYEGLVPNISYYDNITELEYQNILASYKNKAWSLKSNILLHCENDCRVLWDVINAFNSKIFELFSINIFKARTLPSLSMLIFKVKYLNNNLIPVITGAPYDFIKQSYRGGHTDVYVPIAGKCFGYDINSLFSTVMRNCDYPLGKMIHFRGNIFLNNKYADAFGFIKCKITAPNNLTRPVLTTKINTKNGTRTVAPLGTWIDIITTEEFHAYKALGYKFEIFEGYLFDKGNLFKQYIDFWFSIKQNSEPGSVMYFLAKLFLNSLYGRFGLTPNLPKNVILNNEELDQLFKDNPNVKIKNLVDLEEGKTLLQISNNNNPDLSSGDVNIAIASFITANARIYMSHFLADPAKYFNLPGLVIYYTDTDSIFTNMPLPEQFVGKELGKFKLEYVFEEAVFLAPKVYGGIVLNNDGTTTEVVKAKGFKGILSYDTLKSLLVLGSAQELTHEKWSRSLEDGTITVKDSIYTLSVTANKRKNIYVNGIFTNTKPLIINQNKNIVNK
jgi:hypothetical protein